MNLFYSLPIEIQRLIYTYDSTYFNKMKNKLKEINISNKFYVGFNYNLPLEIHNYCFDWKYKNCLKENHKICISRRIILPKNVFLKCINCGKQQDFYWKEYKSYLVRKENLLMY